jgi:hypothetical protein
MTVRVVISLAASLFLSACASEKHWTKPGATYEQFGKDSYDCAQQHSPGGDFKKDMYRACLQGRGYQLVPDGPWEGIRD